MSNTNSAPNTFIGQESESNQDVTTAEKDVDLPPQVSLVCLQKSTKII